MEWLAKLYEWVNVGIYDFATETFAYALEWLVVAKIELMIFITSFMWDVASNVITNIGLSGLINAAWGNLDSMLLNYLTFFRIPDCLNIIIQALVTKFSMRFLGL